MSRNINYGANPSPQDQDNPSPTDSSFRRPNQDFLDMFAPAASSVQRPRNQREQRNRENIRRAPITLNDIMVPHFENLTPQEAYVCNYKRLRLI